MIITLHSAKSQWKHSVVLKALVGYRVTVLFNEDVIEGDMVDITDDDFVMLEVKKSENEEADTYALPLFDIKEIKYC